MFDLSREAGAPATQRTIAVVLSAAVESRFSSPTPKQYMKLAGRMIVEHTIDVFESSTDIDEIVIVSGPEHVDVLWECASRNHWSKRTCDLFIEEVRRARERVDCVVNTAGRLLFKPLDMMTEQEVHESVEVNYLGAVNVARAAAPHLQLTRSCLVLFISSSYTRGRPFYGLYSSSQSAIVNLAQALSEEWAARGVRVVCMNPERTNTRMRREPFGEEPLGTLPIEATTVSRKTCDATIVVSAYNAEQHIERCLESLVAQTLESLEILVIDDGSEDHTLAKIGAFSSRDRRIVPLAQTNRGLSATMNRGIREATGEYIIFFDSDDYADREKLKVMDDARARDPRSKASTERLSGVVRELAAALERVAQLEQAATELRAAGRTMGHQAEPLSVAQHRNPEGAGCSTRNWLPVGDR